MDKFTPIMLWAGIGCFIFAFVLSGLYPYMITDGRETEAGWDEVTKVVSDEFKELKDSYPTTFVESFPRGAEALTPRELLGVAEDDPRRVQSESAWREAYQFALQRGRDVYVAEACWHCHSQYVRTVSNEEQRFGRVRTSRDDNNVLQRPQLWGTRRVGPDLTNVGGLRSNDWHVAHFWDPQATSPGTVMPRYTWFFEDGFKVRRTIDASKAEFGGVPVDESYSYPGLYKSEADAQAAMEKLKATIDSNLASEKDRMFVAKDQDPNIDGLSLIAYLQWLGTWTADMRDADQ